MLEASVVIATYNRGPALAALLGDLDRQTLAPDAFEVVVVDDGSSEPAERHLGSLSVGYRLRAVRQPNQGPAAARDRGARLAQGEVLVILDDDMRVRPDFLACHLEAHRAGAQVVLGHIVAAESLAAMPLFERFHARQLAKFVAAMRAGTQQVHGVDLCTGNVSFRRQDYLAVGGFDRALDRSEDRELGVRLEKHGAKLAFAERAESTHASDHTDLEVWLKRAYLYGIYDHKIAAKHPEVLDADPWRFWVLINALSKPWMAVPIAWPQAGGRLARWVMRAAIACDRLGLEQVAINATTLTYGLEYFRGLRDEIGSARRAGLELARYLRRAAAGGAR